MSSNSDLSGSVSSRIEEDCRFVCNICLDSVKDPVITQCGHLYCWPCLFRWLNTQHYTCPMCKAGVSQENVIPVFIRGSEDDPREKPVQGVDESEIPSRPSAHRPTVDPNVAGSLPGLGPMGALHTQGLTGFAGGFGYFPSLFGLQMQSFVRSVPSPATPEEIQQQEVSRLLMLLGFIVVFGLLFM